MRNPKDNRVHFSELHEMRRSPAHYRYACETRRDTTRAMRVGACFDALVLGGRDYVIYPGDRRGKEWGLFEAANRGRDIFTASEHDDAKGAAAAVLADRIAAPYIKASTHQVIMKWELDGVPCAAGVEGERGGFDLLGHDWIRDLKLTHTTEPGALERHLVQRGWHEQLVFYRDGARANGRTVDVLGIIATEAKPPHTITCMRLSPALIELGERAIRSYIEKYKACEASGHWPGYVQSELEADVPAWMGADEDGGDE
jgi:hypothetical protein